MNWGGRRGSSHVHEAGAQKPSGFGDLPGLDYSLRLIHGYLRVAFARPPLRTRFTGLPIERVGEESERGLRLIVELLGTDRSTLLEFSPDGTTLTPLVSWARPGIELFTQVPLAAGSWYHAQPVRGETVRLARLPGDLPGEAVQEREYCRRIGLLSNLTVPISVGGQPVCALAIGAFRDARDWPDPVVDRVRLIGQVLTNALHRRRVEAELHKAVAELEQTKFRKLARPKGAGNIIRLYLIGRQLDANVGLQRDFREFYGCQIRNAESTIGLLPSTLR